MFSPYPFTSKMASENTDAVVVAGKDTTDAYRYLPLFDGLDCKMSY